MEDVSVNTKNAVEMLSASSMVWRRIAPRLLKENWYVNPKTSKFTFIRGVAIDRPWIYTSMDSKRYCGLYQLIFNEFRFVPSYCLDCWKVCVTPRRVTELFRLYDIQDRHFKPHKVPCKCGMDLREHTPHRYGGYWYCYGQDQGERRWLEVRKLVDKYIGDHVQVILKRYCTEFEMITGPTDKYEQPAQAKAIEEAVYSMIEVKKFEKAPQPAGEIQKIMHDWIKRAWEIGDMSVQALNDHEPLYKPLVTYHGEIEKKYREEKERSNG